MINPTETLNQLTMSNNGINRLKAMIGAKNFAASDKDNYISFRFMRGAANKSNYIKITLDLTDTYNVEFGYIRGHNYRSVSVHEGIYDDMLYTLFIDETGLSIRL